ncbi:autoinducer binding domain-containing protein [Bosea sp. SSUT16]|uniref:Autoinducer binding domain-containing protein n=1 Tax=Bosea spartocytisi TaxID=2773451 RepID=A0A927EBG7_9HYPH|nr:autoinducer binding domain-containing protein [Bosea spartocytisi]
MLKTSRTWSFVEQMGRAANDIELRLSLLKITNEFGLSSAFGGLIPEIAQSHSEAEIESRVIVRHLPEEWSARYIEQNYLYCDPIVRRLQRNRDPFSWAECYGSYATTRRAKILRGEAAEFGLIDGYVVSVTTLDQSHAAISFGGQSFKLAGEERSALAFATSLFVGHVLSRRTSGRSAAALSRKVTAREYDCLLWSAEGKSEWEISVILGISKPTVTKHILSAREKLGAVTKAHAIAIAMRERILR